MLVNCLQLLWVGKVGRKKCWRSCYTQVSRVWARYETTIQPLLRNFKILKTEWALHQTSTTTKFSVILCILQKGRRGRRGGWLHQEPVHDRRRNLLPRRLPQRWGHPLHPLGGLELLRGVLLLLHNNDHHRLWWCCPRFESYWKIWWNDLMSINPINNQNAHFITLSPIIMVNLLNTLDPTSFLCTLLWAHFPPIQPLFNP